MQYDEEILFFNRKLSSFKPSNFTNKKCKYNNKEDYTDNSNLVEISSLEALSSDENTSLSTENTSENSENTQGSQKRTLHTKNSNSTNEDTLVNIPKTCYKNTKKKATEKSHSTTSRQSSSPRERSNSLTPPPRLSKQVIQEGRRMRLTQETKINWESGKVNNELNENNDLYIHNNINVKTYDQHATDKQENICIVNEEIKKSGKNNETLTIFEITVIGKRNIKTDSPDFFPETWEEPVLFKIYENQAFKIMKNAFCSHKKLSKSDYDKIVLVFKEKRIYESSTPKGNGMLKYDSKITIGRLHSFSKMFPNINTEAMSKPSYTYLMNRIEKRKRLRNSNTCDFFDLTKKTPSSTPLIIIDDPSIELILRNKNNETLKLSINSNATISELINTFRISKNINTNSDITLRFEGEKLQPNLSISSYDFENEDLIDVQINN
ncbi:hypothetical protein PCANB_002723 [Pneumocystis canis]|nr:hypothetical protein PCANB_002723 [Pneumocystis canis]